MTDPFCPEDLRRERERADTGAIDLCWACLAITAALAWGMIIGLYFLGAHIVDLVIALAWPT